MSSNNYWTVKRTPEGQFGAYHTWAEDDCEPADNPDAVFDGRIVSVECHNRVD